MNLKMETNIQYVKDLPAVNVGSSFLVLDYIKNDIASLWYEFIEKTIMLSMIGGEHFKTIRDAFSNDMQIHNLKRSYARDMLGIGDKLSVIDIIHEDGNTTYKQLLSLEEIISIYLDSNEDVAKRMTIDRFFVFLYNKNILQYPIVRKSENYYRPENWRAFIDETEVVSFLRNRYEQNDNVALKSYGFNAMLSIVSSTKWQNLSDIKDEDLFSIEKFVQEHTQISKKRQSYTTTVLSDLRLSLINIGRNDILKPKISIDYRKNYDKIRKFNMINTDEFPNLKYLKQKAMNYYDVLEHEGLAVSTIRGELSSISVFFNYLMEYYPDREFDKNAIEEIFNPSNEINLHSILSSKYQRAKPALNKIVKFLVNCELFTMKAKSNIPRDKQKVSRQNYRSAMPKEMIRHIVQIIKERPPLLKTKWDRKKVDSSWWEHEVYPVYPLMMLFGYYIPVRGEQVRNLCREKSFIIENGRVEKIIINTDKNVNRKNYQELPCVWEDLQIFSTFLKWHKEYYKNIPKIKYHNDVNSPWEDIEPLFNTPQHLEPISQASHYNYHKKILCQYQLEIMQEAKEKNLEYYPIVAWAKKGKKFFNTVEELNRCSSDRLKDIEIMYDLHSLRVTGATRYLENGLGINLVMQLTGHTTPDTLLRIYINLTLDEKKDKLKSAIEDIYFNNPKEHIKNTSDLIRGEFVKAYEQDENKLRETLANNDLFSLPRSLPENSMHTEYVLGVEVNHHPSTWLPMIHGICPAVKCPNGREDRCSLCPYLITGKLFINGIVLKANNALARFQRDSLLKEEENEKGYKNSALAQSLELQLEEILGWWDILGKIDNKLFNKNNDEEQNKEASSLVNNSSNKKSAFLFESCSTELAYLANAYDAEVFGFEHDKIGLKMLTIKAIKIANENKDNAMINKLAGDELSSIDYLMGYYTKNQIEDKHFKNFIENIDYGKRSNSYKRLTI
ncbi:hypothetical protein N5T98_04145 [Aliarcobacter cryaerophilus]|uniref:hypothetical protein n=1 Tax=Aliarcobacter cryaerophilus TaxID=28198 RepID=UPI0021B5B55A|nr:hypothetical protein [Aliarcobacter cryaerophilus]MCT7486219.1 hypothetical protein [Aliarcobacter cryaerophilus]MCT7490282.1 hypothetical protein [Aliarcobacter cryaerophilus]